MKNFNFLSNLLQRVSAMSGMRAETINYDGQPTVNRRANMTSVLRHCKASDVRVAQEWLQKSSARVAQGLRKSVRFAATILVLLFIGVGSAWGTVTALTIPKSWAASGGSSAYTEALGCTKNGLGSDYSASGTKLKFDNTGDYMIIQLASSPAYVSYAILGNSFSGGTFKVQESSNGSTYTDVATYTSSPSGTKTNNLNAATRYIKFVYTTKDKGNIGLGTIVIKARTSVTLDKNGGTADGSAVIAYNATTKESITAPINAGSTLLGYWEGVSTGNKVLNADGSFAATNVSGWITSSKWTKDAATAKLYARWETSCDNNVTISKGSETNGTFTLSKSGPQATCSGLSVVVTPSSSTHYHVGSVTATTPTTGGAPTVTGPTDGKYTVTYAANSTGSSTINVTFEADPQYTVNWYVNGSIAHSQTGYEGATLTSIPTPTSSDCDGSKVFVGWYTSTYSHASTAPAYVSPTTIPNGGANYYAVFATESIDASGEETITINTSVLTSYATVDKKIGGITFKSTGNWGAQSWSSYTYLQGANGKVLYNHDAFPGYIKSITITPQSSAGVSGKAQLAVGTTVQPSSYSADITTTSTTNYTAINNYTYLAIKANGATALASISIIYASVSTTYSNYETNCCTELGSINGSISWTHPNEAVVSWDNLANVSSWTVKYKEHGAGAWTTAFTNKTGLDSEITVYSDGGTDNKMKSTIATTCNTAYDFLIIANPASGYCEKEETLENKNSGKWSVAYSLIGVTKSSGPATGANVCGDYTAVFAPSSIAYALPSDVTVQIGGVTKIKDTDYTWDSSTGTLSIASAKITGDLSITVTGIEVGCSADPTIGAASLSGAFGLSSVGVTVGTSSTGSAYCAWTDYGFVWGTSANPTVSDNKVQIGNSDAATTWSGNLTGSFSTGTTYYFRAYGKNSKDDAAYVYGEGGSFTPRSVTFNSNGGSAVATVYVNSESAVSEPSAPTRTGYDFVKWQLNGTDYNFSSPVNANITLDAVWSAKSYTVTFDQQSGSGGSENVSATYDAAMPSATMPTRSGYDFGGYYGSEGGAGTQYYAADGSSAHTWDVADAKTLYAQWTAKNYTITLNNEGADSGKEGTESISVTFNANTNLTSAITKPVKDGYKFGGYYTEEDGSGTQIIDENGNVKASVASYTSATKQWIYAGDIELHAYWKPSYTVTWSVNGETTTEQVVSGEQVAALPTAPTSSDCDDAKVFVGWRATAIAGVSAANPGSIFTTQAASPAITGDVTFYAVFADVSGGDEIEFKLPFDNKSECGVNNYTSTWVAEIDDYSWTISNFNNNKFSTGWTSEIRCGRDGNASIASITTDAAISFRVDSVYINLTATNDSYINSAKLQISSSSGISTPDEINIPVNTTGVKGLKITSPAKDKYYRVIFDCKSYTANGFVRIGSIVYKQKLDTANYVTTCSSCDADATFTNTTPTVSAIDCDAATLTMTGGLATLGAGGCNISDYGFVIGTTDNPAIGGSGVTKLQAGTTNPTTGANFSYDAEGLTAGTHYYIRAYATNRHGTAYSGSQNFWTKGVSSIAITTAPTKTKYVEGESFDKTGMVVTATMADGSTEDVTSDCTFSPSLSTKLSDETTVRATYSLCDVDKTADQDINVYTLTVTEGTNDTYGTAGKTDNKVTVTGLGDHKTYTVTVTSGNADKIDNGDGTYTITNATGNVTVRVDYADAVQVKVYYKVDGVTVTGLTQDVYQSETTTLPTASELATEMTAQGMEIPDDSYPNFVGWSETEFGAQISEPTLVTGTPTINVEKTYYAVYTNLNVIRLDKTSTGVSTSNPAEGSADVSITVGGKGFKRNYLIYQNEAGGVNPFLQFKKNATYFGRIYNSDALTNILKVVVAYKNADSNVKVYACSAAGTISGDAITAGTRGTTDPYVYMMPANTQYLMVRGDNETTYKTYYIDIYYSPATVEYMTQFCPRYDITGVTKSGTAVTGGTLSSNYNSACEGKSVELEAVVSTGYQFNGWIIKKTADLTQDVTSTLLGANASSLTPPAFSMPDYAITVSASITEKEVTGWTWKQTLPDDSQIAIPSKVVLYVGQRAEFDLIEYDPSDVLAKKKGYGVTKEDAYLTQNAKAADYYKADAKAAVESTTLTLTSTSNSSVQEVINIQIKALPSVTFEDHVHSVVFSAVAATIDETDKRVVYLTKTTPTTSDFSGTTYNTCEEQHEHLVGWIESSWADEHPNATHSEIAGAGAGVFYTAGASIDVEAQNGKTFYAVWSKIE